MQWVQSQAQAAQPSDLATVFRLSDPLSTSIALGNCLREIQFLHLKRLESNGSTSKRVKMR